MTDSHAKKLKVCKRHTFCRCGYDKHTCFLTYYHQYITIKTTKIACVNPRTYKLSRMLYATEKGATEPFNTNLGFWAQQISIPSKVILFLSDRVTLTREYEEIGTSYFTLKVGHQTKCNAYVAALANLYARAKYITIRYRPISKLDELTVCLKANLSANYCSSPIKSVRHSSTSSFANCLDNSNLYRVFCNLECTVLRFFYFLVS